MEKQHPIDLLPGREAETLTQWLKAHPGVEIICRDRASCYAEGAKVGEALKRMLEKHHPELQLAVKTLALQQQQQKQQEILDATDIIGPSVSLSSPTALRALRFQEARRLSFFMSAKLSE